MRHFKTIAYIAVGCCLVGAGCLGLWYWCDTPDAQFRSSNQPVEEGAWIGYDESDFLQRLGEPIAVHDKYEAVGRKNPPPMPPGPYKTLVYKGKTGVLYVWMHHRGKDYQCFDSLWFDDGVVF